MNVILFNFLIKEMFLRSGNVFLNFGINFLFRYLKGRITDVLEPNKTKMR